jgi:iron complex outermembrane receptor protein
MLKHFFVLMCCAYLLVGAAQAQTTCMHSLKGHVYDADLKTPIVGASVLLVGTENAVVSSGDGYFECRKLCSGEQTIRVEMKGYRLFQQTFNVPTTLPVEIQLQPLATHLQSITIFGNRSKEVVEPPRKLNAEQLFRTQGQTLGKALEAIPGVYNLSTGQSISKPVVRGLHSNRVLIVNNELRQESQQWGAEHAPEIDAFQATDLQLITGPRCLRYGSDALGGVVLMQADPVVGVSKPSWTASSSLFSNGRGAVISLMGEMPWKKHSAWTTRVQGTLRRSGNAQAPTYNLGNTGFYERAANMSIGYKKNKLTMLWHFSDFFTRLGILNSSHIGNLSDLYAAFQREQPIDTAHFTYRIGFPYQQLHHQTVQWQGHYRVNYRNKWEWQYALQRNRRKEFDKMLKSQQGAIKPALDFNLITHQFDVRWIHQYAQMGSGQLGLSAQMQTNEYYASFLIPNYFRSQMGLYSIEQITRGRVTAELGVRYDVQLLNVLRWEQQQLQNKRFEFHGPALMGGLRIEWPKWTNYIYGGSTWRAPHVNELYSYGIHHSAATFEMGDSNLKPERNYQFNWSMMRGKANTFRWIGTAYTQYIHQFIYLQPVFPATLTLRGAFPTFQYTPIDVIMAGFDMQVESPRQWKWPWHVKSAYLLTRNIETGYAPVGMPPARVEGEMARRIHLPSGEAMRLYTGLSYTFKAMGLASMSDYLSPPSAYWLCRIGFETDFHWQGFHGQIGLGIENLFNVNYRDYLNRYRYFANEPGRNMVLQIKTSRH